MGDAEGTAWRYGSTLSLCVKRSGTKALKNCRRQFFGQRLSAGVFRRRSVPPCRSFRWSSLPEGIGRYQEIGIYNKKD